MNGYSNFPFVFMWNSRSVGCPVSVSLESKYYKFLHFLHRNPGLENTYLGQKIQRVSRQAEVGLGLKL